VSDLLSVTMLAPPVIDVISGVPGPVGPPGAPMPGFVMPEQFGAVGDNVADDTAAVVAASNATRTGGTIYFSPNKTYRCTGPLHYYQRQNWLGCGTSSVIHLANDLWPGGQAPAPRFISPGDSGGGAFGKTRFSNLVITGPQNRQQYGYPPNHTIALSETYQLMMDRVTISSFFSGLELVSDHGYYYSCAVFNCYYNVDYSDAMVTSGNHLFVGCDLSNTWLASVHVGGGAKTQLECDEFVQCHFGWGPVGILVTNAADPTTPWDANGIPNCTVNNNVGFITSSNFENCLFEMIGNGAVIDVGTSANATFAGPTRFAPFNFIWQGATVAPTSYTVTTAPLTNPETQKGYVMNLRNGGMVELTMGGEASPGAVVGALGALRYSGSNAGGGIVHWRGGVVPPNFLGSDGHWTQALGQGLFVDAAGSNTAAPGVANGKAEARFVPAGSTIAAGDLVELYDAAAPAVQRATGTRPLYGVALTPGSPTQAQCWVLVATEGRASVNRASSAGTLGSGLAVYANATNPYLVDTTSTGSRPVGTSTALAGAGAATSMVKLNL
jgi:hypothetical protein